MARTALTVNQIAPSGLAAALAAANVDGHSVANDGRTFIHVKNASGAPINVTVKASAYKVGGLALTDVVIAVPATTGERLIGPFDPTAFNQSGGEVNVDFSAVTSVTVAAYRL